MSTDTPELAVIRDLLETQATEAVSTQDWLVAADNFRAICHAAAGVECKSCGGSGTRCYGSTSTWRGGIAGQAMTWGTCDTCWGSGRSDAPGVDLRALTQRLQAAETSRAVTASGLWLARKMGVTLDLLREQLPEVVAKLRGLRMSGFWAAQAVGRLADAIDAIHREAAAPPDDGA